MPYGVSGRRALHCLFAFVLFHFDLQLLAKWLGGQMFIVGLSVGLACPEGSGLRRGKKLYRFHELARVQPMM